MHPFLTPRSQRSCLSYSPGARRQLTSGRRRWTGCSLVSHCGNVSKRKGVDEKDLRINYLWLSQCMISETLGVEFQDPILGTS